MNKLESVILDQYARVRAAGVDGAEALAETQGEIMSVATPDLAIEIIRDDRTSGYREGYSSTRIMREQMDPKSISSRAAKMIQNGHGLARIGMLKDRQGYSGGIIFDHGESIVYGNSMTFETINLDDPIQAAMGQTFYPPMMWVKALRAEAYRNRAEAAERLSIAEWLSELGLSLGSIALEHGDIIGATGFMPGQRLLGKWDDSVIDQHITSEGIEAFRLSGLCDQAVLDPDILLDTPSFAASILAVGGSLN